MRGRVLGKATNKYEVFVADSGTSVSIIPVNIAKRNGIKKGPVNPDEPNHSGVTGTQLTVLGQTNIWIKLSTVKKTQEISALVCQEESEESLIGLDSHKDMIGENSVSYLQGSLKC